MPLEGFLGYSADSPIEGFHEYSIGSPVESLLESGDIQLLHVHHGDGGAVGLVPERATHHLLEDGRDDLPRHTVLVRQPTTLLGGFISAIPKSVPKVVDFFLGGASRARKHLSRVGTKEEKNVTSQS